MTPIPTNCGKRFLPKILDELATSDPHRIIYSIAKSTDISDGFREISARVFIDAVNKLAWWLVNQVGKSTKQENLGYIGPHDLRHIILTHASVKAGYQPLFLSPKNSTEGALAVLEASNCQIWVQPVEKPCEQEFIQHRPMRVLNMPELNELLDAQGTKNYPYDPTWEKNSREVFCLLHTSGTTGLPKPISWPHALIGTMDAVRLLPPTEGDGGLLPWTEDWNEGDRIHSAFPMSHGAGIIMNIIVPALFGMHCILGPPGVLPNISLLDSLAEHGKIDVWSIVPSLVDELGDAPDVLEKFRPSKFICASGGPVTKVISNRVNKVVRVLNLTGTTEGLFIGNLWVPREDWHWFAFHPYSGFEFKEVEPGVYEHWVHRNEHWELFQGIFHTFVHENSINLKDLYVRHPTNPNLYAYHGRNDDIIVLSNGYKIQPLDMEAIITTHIAVKGCLIVGTGRSQAALLIELNNPAIGNDALFESLWLAVQRANASSLHKDQLHRDFIMFSQPDKPFVRTDKGTIKRAATVKLYEEYISEFYHSRLSEVDVQISAAEIDLTSSESVSNAVAHIIHSLTPKLKNIGDSTDLFEAGLDSLLAVRTIRTVRAAIGLSGEQLSPRHLYANPTIAKFAAAIVRMTSSLTLGDGQRGAENNFAETLEQMKYLLARYKKGFSLKSNGFDLLNPKIYVKMAIYLPTKQNTTRNQVLGVLTRGFERLTSLIPAVDGKVDEFRGQPNSGKKGVQMISIPSHDKHTSKGISRAATHPERPRQIVSKDLTEQLPSFDELRAKSFVPLFEDELVLDAPWFPERPADIFRAQVNFIRGGVLLVTGLHHSAFDGTAIVTTLRAWAECCRFVQGDKSANCSWLHPDSMDRNLVHAQWETEGYAQPAEEIDPETWGYLGFEAPSGLVHKGPTDKFVSPTQPPVAPKRTLQTRTFHVSVDKLQRLTAEVALDPESKGLVSSASDILQALAWRAAIRARYRAATEIRGEQVNASADESILELPIDGRPFFSGVPDSYMGNMLVVNRLSISIDTLCSDSTSIGRIALLIRQAAPRVTSQVVHDSYALLERVEDYTQLRYAFMRLYGFDLMITNMMLVPASAVAFGDNLFANEAGVPNVIRPLLGGFNKAFRMCIILPMRDDGGVDLQLGLFPEEFDMISQDKEFARYATFLG